MSRLKKLCVFRHTKISSVDVLDNFYDQKRQKILFSKTILLTVPPDGIICTHSDHKLRGVPNSYIVSYVVGKDTMGKKILLHCLFFNVSDQDIGNKINANCEVIEIFKNNYKTIHLKIVKYDGRPKELRHMTIAIKDKVKKTESFLLPQAWWTRINFVIIQK